MEKQQAPGREKAPANQQAGKAVTGEMEGTTPARPFGLKHILVPVDFSECSRKALQYALAFAGQFKAEVTLVHVVPDVSDEIRLITTMPELQQELLKEGRQHLAKEIEACGSRPVKLTPLVKKGTPYHEIVQAAQELDTDLIVIGTHGRTGITHVLLGSTSERVVRHAPCPVLVVREREHEFVGEH